MKTFAMIKKFSSPTQQRGLLGETIAHKYLISKGFRIIATNVAFAVGELDCIAERNNILYFIEIKTSFTKYAAEWNVSREKIQKMADAADEYISLHQVSCETRFAVVLVTVTRETRTAHVRFMGNILPDEE